MTVKASQIRNIAASLGFEISGERARELRKKGIDTRQEVKELFEKKADQKEAVDKIKKQNPDLLRKEAREIYKAENAATQAASAPAPAESATPPAESATPPAEESIVAGVENNPTQQYLRPLPAQPDVSQYSTVAEVRDAINYLEIQGSNLQGNPEAKQAIQEQRVALERRYFELKRQETPGFDPNGVKEGRSVRKLEISNRIAIIDETQLGLSHQAQLNYNNPEQMMAIHQQSVQLEQEKANLKKELANITLEDFKDSPIMQFYKNFMSSLWGG